MTSKWRLQQELDKHGGVHEVDLLEAEQVKDDSKKEHKTKTLQEFFDDYKKALQEVGGAEARVAVQVTEVETARPCKGD